MSAVIEGIRRVARQRVQRLILPEGTDARILKAAAVLARDRLADVAIAGTPGEVREAARRAEVGLRGIEVLDATAAEEIERATRALERARGGRLSPADRDRHARDPLVQAAARVGEDLADCFVAGSTRPTSDVLRAALWLIGLAPGVKLVSSFFLMVCSATPGLPGERILCFADCAVVPEPGPEQLAEIGCLAAEHFALLTHEVPHTAFLSFSTRGSADHARVEKVRQAVGLARSRRPDLHFDGELQADAALDPGVGRRKAPDSVVAGHANVLVFPDLDSGNIGYKLVQRLGGARAYGPILMGLARQANDLSRGCTAEDVVEVSTIACALSAARPGAPSPSGPRQRPTRVTRPMPTLDYLCGMCGHRFELFHGIKDAARKRCPRCKGPARRVPAGGAGLLFKGSGFYVTDYRSKSYQEKARQEKGTASGGGTESGGKSKGKPSPGGGAGGGGGSTPPGAKKPGSGG